jgi:hypothetical protein
MQAIQHISNNDVLGAPKGVPIEECHALRITRARYPDGTHVVISYWKPDDAELDRLKAGLPVRLSVWGHTHAPVNIGVAGDGHDAVDSEGGHAD